MAGDFEGAKLDNISLIINGQEVEVQERATVLEAAQEAGIYIPALCYHSDLPPYGACRLCVVEIEGMRGFPTACTILVPRNYSNCGAISLNSLWLNTPTNASPVPRICAVSYRLSLPISEWNKSRFLLFAGIWLLTEITHSSTGTTTIVSSVDAALEHVRRYVGSQQLHLFAEAVKP